MKTKYLLLAILLLSGSSLFAQNFTYSYDVSGNRIRRDLKVGLQSTLVNESQLMDSTALLQLVDPTSTIEEDNFRTVLYPNPTSGNLTLELPDLQAGEAGSLSIINVMGRIVYHQKKVNSIQSLDISSYPVGNYFLRIIAGKNIVSLKIIKK